MTEENRANVSVYISVVELLIIEQPCVSITVTILVVVVVLTICEMDRAMDLRYQLRAPRATTIDDKDARARANIVDEFVRNFG